MPKAITVEDVDVYTVLGALLRDRQSYLDKRWEHIEAADPMAAARCMQHVERLDLIIDRFSEAAFEDPDAVHITEVHRAE